MIPNRSPAPMLICEVMEGIFMKWMEQSKGIQNVHWFLEKLKEKKKLPRKKNAKQTQN